MQRVYEKRYLWPEKMRQTAMVAPVDKQAAETAKRLAHR
jgi:hypothetical protein